MMYKVYIRSMQGCLETYYMSEPEWLRFFASFKSYLKKADYDVEFKSHSSSDSDSRTYPFLINFAGVLTVEATLVYR